MVTLVYFSFCDGLEVFLDPYTYFLYYLYVFRHILPFSSTAEASFAEPHVHASEMWFWYYFGVEFVSHGSTGFTSLCRNMDRVYSSLIRTVWDEAFSERMGDTNKTKTAWCFFNVLMFDLAVKSTARNFPESVVTLRIKIVTLPRRHFLCWPINDVRVFECGVEAFPASSVSWSSCLFLLLISSSLPRLLLLVLFPSSLRPVCLPITHNAAKPKLRWPTCCMATELAKSSSSTNKAASDNEFLSLTKLAVKLPVVSGPTVSPWQLALCWRCPWRALMSVM